MAQALGRGVVLPEISRFFGVVIAMFYDDHNPPHFHARYGEESVVIGIRSLDIIDGRMSPRALGLVIEWAAQNRDGLLAAWEDVRALRSPAKIPPLA